MKIFESGGWGNKVNFVDENNVVLGYDYSSSCCEDFGYFISNKISDEILDDRDPENLEDYSFDKDFFQEFSPKDHYNSGGIVVFKIVSKIGDVLYIHLYNIHNGYYSHGFNLAVGGQTIQDGSL